MTKYIVDLWLDGYENEEDRKKAEEEFIYEQLNFTASSVEISEYKEPENKTCKNCKHYSDNTEPPCYECWRYHATCGGEQFGENWEPKEE